VLVFLRRNLVWMLLSFVLSLALWTIVTTAQNPDVIDVFPNIPVELANVPPGMIARTEPAPVRITVVAPADVMPTLRAAKFQAVADLSRGAPGLQDVPIEVHSIDSRVRVDDVAPPRTSILLERMARRDVPAKARLTGSQPAGYLVRAPKMTPDTVTVSGPQSLVDQVVGAIAEVGISGVTTSISQVYKIVPQNANGERVDRVTVSPENVLVELAVEQERAFKAVPVTVEVRGAPAAGYQVVGLRVDPTSITIEGDARTVDTVQFVATQPVDLNNAGGDIQTNVELDLPNGIRVARAQQIVVRVFVAPIEGSKVVEVAPTLQNVRQGLNGTVSPSTVRVTVVGPMPVLASIGPRDLPVIVDAAGLGPGNQQVRPRVAVPNLVRLQATQPDQVQVAIVAPPTPTAVPEPTRTPGA
jgi:YbbR domain-containing protein